MVFLCVAFYGLALPTSVSVGLLPSVRRKPRAESCRFCLVLRAYVDDVATGVATGSCFILHIVFGRDH